MDMIKLENSVGNKFGKNRSMSGLAQLSQTHRPDKSTMPTK